MTRRVKVLSEQIAPLLPKDASVLDIGTGSGEVGARIQLLRPDTTISGVEVLARGDEAIPVVQYDGLNLPFADKSFDAVMLIDVLHHTTRTREVICEALRVSKQVLVIKDHNCDTGFNRRVMEFTDWFANSQHGVALPYNFWSRAQWRETWRSLGVRVLFETTNVGLYPKISRLVFAENMDFIACLSAVPESAQSTIALRQ